LVIIYNLSHCFFFRSTHHKISTLFHINSQKFIFSFFIIISLSFISDLSLFFDFSKIFKVFTSQIFFPFTFNISSGINFLFVFIGIKISTIFHDNFIFEDIEIFAL